MRQCIRPAVTFPAPLIQIDRRFTTSCGGLWLSVETDSNGWRSQVRDRQDGRTLYSAQRYSLGAAKIAATEFVAFGTTSSMLQKSPEAMAQDLAWHECW